jgi:hypothetical protein
MMFMNDVYIFQNPCALPCFVVEEQISMVSILELVLIYDKCLETDGGCGVYQSIQGNISYLCPMKI